MANEFKLSYTGLEINEKLKQVETNTSNIDALSEEIDDLNKAVTDIQSIISDEAIELYDAAEITEDVYWHLDTGSGFVRHMSYTGWNVTQYMPIDNVNQYKYSGLTTFGNSPKASFFDADKKAIVGGYFKPVEGENIVENIPSGAKYISFSVNDVDVNSFSFVKYGKSIVEDIVYGNLKELPNPSESKLLIVPTKDGGLAYSDMEFWRWAKDNSLALSSRSYQTVRVSDGAVINSYNCDTVYNIYSVTKLLSCVVACMYIDDYNEEITVLETDFGSERSEKIIKPNDTLTYEAILNSALIQSDNNACNALRRPIGYIINPNAQNNGQAIVAFYNKMQEVADSLGMTNTDCDSARISASAGVRSTTADLCKLIAHVYKNIPKIVEICNKLTYQMVVTGVNARTWEISSTTTESARTLIPEYVFGKTGSGSAYYAYSYAWECSDGIVYATSLLEGTLATGDRFKDARCIMDEVYTLIN